MNSFRSADGPRRCNVTLTNHGFHDGRCQGELGDSAGGDGAERSFDVCRTSNAFWVQNSAEQEMYSQPKIVALFRRNTSCLASPATV